MKGMGAAIPKVHARTGPNPRAFFLLQRMIRLSGEAVSRLKTGVFKIWFEKTMERSLG